MKKLLSVTVLFTSALVAFAGDHSKAQVYQDYQAMQYGVSIARKSHKLVFIMPDTASKTAGQRLYVYPDGSMKMGKLMPSKNGDYLTLYNVTTDQPQEVKHLWVKDRHGVYQVKAKYKNGGHKDFTVYPVTAEQMKAIVSHM